jgi:hypothetical protein
MSRIVAIFIFIAIFFALDFYVFQGFKVLVKKWIPSYNAIALFFYWAIPAFLLAVIIIKVVWFSEVSKSTFFLFAYSILTALFLAKFIWFIFLLTDDLIRLIRYTSDQLTKSNSMKSISRSEFIITIGFFFASTLFGSLVYGIARGAHNYTVKKRRLPIKGLPKSFMGSLLFLTVKL